MSDKYIFTKELREAYETLPMSLAVYQYIDGKIYPQLFSDGMCKTTGKKRIELYDTTIRELFGIIHKKDIYSFVESVYNCITQDETLNMIIRSKLRNESEYTLMSCKGYNQVMSDGNKLFFLEVSELNRTYCENESFRDVLDNSPNGILVVDIANKEILYHNVAIEDLMSNSTPEKEGVKCYEYFFKREKPCEDCPLDIRQKQGKDYKFCKVEEKWFTIKAEKTDWKNSKVFIIYVNDSETIKRKSVLNKRKVGAAVENSVFEANINGEVKPVRIAKGYSKIVGTKHDEHLKLLNENIFIDLHPQDAETLKNDIYKAIKDQLYKYDKVYRYIDRKDNRYKLVRVTGVAIPQSDGKFLILANHIEMDEIKEEYDHLAKAIKFTGVQYVEWYVKEDKLYITVYDNKSDLKKRLISEDPYSRATISSFVHSSYVSDYYEETNKLRNGEKDEVLIDTLCLNYNGNYEWQRHYMTVTEKDEYGLPIKIVGTSNPIEELMELEEKFNILLKQYGLSTWVYYPDKHLAKMLISENDYYRDSLLENFPDVVINEKDIHEDDIPVIKDAYRRIDSGEPEVEFLLRIRCNGSLKWIKTNYTSVFSDECKLLYAIGSSKDVTDEINLKKEYSDAYNLQKDSKENTVATIIYNIDKDKIVSCIDCDDYFGVADGLSYDERLKLFATFIVSPADKEWVLSFNRENCFKMYSEGKRSFSREIIFEAEQGKLWLFDTVKFIKNPEDGNLMMFFTTEDNTQKHETELFLRFLATNNYDFSVILNMSDTQFNYMFYYPDGGGIRGYETRHGKDFFEIARKELFKRISNQQAEEIMTLLEPSNILKRLETEDSIVYVYNGEIEGNKFVKKLTITYYNEEEKEVGLTQQDVTLEFEEEEKINQKLARALNEVKRANSIKDDFLGRMSHDMRTPMNAIIGISNFGIEEINNKKAIQYFSQIKESSNYLLGLLNDILDMQKLEYGKANLKPEVINIYDSMKSNRDIIKVRAEEKGVNFEMHYDDSEGSIDYIYIDALRINQIMLNVLNNAIKYTSAEGLVKWDLKILKKGKGYELCSTISDDGIGMSEEYIHDLYTPFVRENERMTTSEGGVGLGLAITKRLIDLMDGEIDCESKIGEGTTFEITIPVKIPDKKLVDEYRAKNNVKLNCENNLIGKKVLLCEDIDINAKIASKILETFGMIVTIAGDGVKAVENAENEDFDAILMDIHMPLMDGLTAARKIREFDKKIPIIALSANAYKKDVENSLEAGMNAHLSKPIDKHKLIKVLCEIVK